MLIMSIILYRSRMKIAVAMVTEIVKVLQKHMNPKITIQKLSKLAK